MIVFCSKFIRWIWMKVKRYKPSVPKIKKCRDLQWFFLQFSLFTSISQNVYVVGESIWNSSLQDLHTMTLILLKCTEHSSLNFASQTSHRLWFFFASKLAGTIKPRTSGASWSFERIGMIIQWTMECLFMGNKFAISSDHVWRKFDFHWQN